jgi:hypothetical protein
VSLSGDKQIILMENRSIGVFKGTQTGLKGPPDDQLLPRPRAPADFAENGGRLFAGTRQRLLLKIRFLR